MMNNFSNMADKAISDEELEQVSGGSNPIQPLYCPVCQTTVMWELGTPKVCSKGHALQ